MEDKVIICPLCKKPINIDSIRNHRDGRKRVYWECKDCNLSIMHREA